MNWSPQQKAFLDWCNFATGSCVLEAVAGAGKTTTILRAALDFAQISKQVAICAYNKKIADEIKGKIAAMGLNWRDVQAGTVHSFGFSAYRKAFEKEGVVVDEDKMSKIIETETLCDPRFEHLQDFAGPIAKLVGYAKQRAIGIFGAIRDDNLWYEMAEHFDVWDEESDSLPKEDIIRAAQAALLRSIEKHTFIDFDDMIYMPLVKRVRFWRFPVVMVDEAQDTNPARRALVAAMLMKGGRLIAVGDRHQAIYGFTGADGNSLDLIAKEFSAKLLPLTTSYRCPKSVIAFAQQWVSHIEAHESAPEGTVGAVTLDDFFKRNDLTEGSAVLCRNTKPLVSLALQLIRRRIACRVEGRDIAASLKKLATRWKVSSVHTLRDRLAVYLERETTKLLAKKQELKLAIIEDTVETIRTVIDACLAEQKDKVTDVVAYLDSLFADNVSGMLVLSTIHKSKGREWPRVFWLDRAGTCPSKWARQDWQVEQERNLQYVAAIRSQDTLLDLLVGATPEKEQRQ